MAGNLRNFSSDAALTAGQRRLYELIDSSLIEFGSLESRQKAIVSPVKELKIGKDQLKELVSKARANHPQINTVARGHKLIANAKASGKDPDLLMFRRLQPAAKSAGMEFRWRPLGLQVQGTLTANTSMDIVKFSKK